MPAATAGFTHAGFCGKVPSRGDFVGQGLPAHFREPWDAWVRSTILDCRERLGERWQDTFLSAPVWRFALAPGACGPLGWTGVVASSVDRVGRPFPVTLALSPPPEIPPAAMLSGWEPGFERLTDLALQMMRDDAAVANAPTAVAMIGEKFATPAWAFSALSPTPAKLPRLEPGESVRIEADPGMSLRRTCADAIARAGEHVTLMWPVGWGILPFVIVGAGLPNTKRAPSIWEAAGTSV